ncbi:MAG: hypothetical protein QGH59_01255, partial [Gemmatimonadota bacterium]|nr:hypothetical protein [Gemmatimonadota bacterium]
MRDFRPPLCAPALSARSLRDSPADGWTRTSPPGRHRMKKLLVGFSLDHPKWVIGITLAFTL